MPADSLDEVTLVCLPDARAVEFVGPLPEGIAVVVWNGIDPPVAGLDRVDMFVPGYTELPIGAEALARLTHLRVIQLLSAGVEPWLDRVPDGAVLCNGRGIHGASTAELAVAGILSTLRRLPYFREAQMAHRWAREAGDGLDGSRVLVLGAGDIGSRIAASVTPLGADVTLVARRARPGVRTLDELATLLPDHEVVAIALPHTPETHHLVDATFLAAMPTGALLVNVARGAIVDTGALLAELRAQRLRAFLDVTDPEPLPSDHPLWAAPNLTRTPHVGGGTHGWQRRAYRLVRDQVIRLHDGVPLENVVTDGY